MQDHQLSSGAGEASTDRDLFYLQDSRGYVGNDMLWWAKGGCGYTTDLRKAEVYTRDKALRQHHCRESDIPWPKEYIDDRARPAVDMQYCKRDEALRSTGIVLVKQQKPKREVLRCYHCGVFLSERDYYGNCPKCEGENRP